MRIARFMHRKQNAAMHGFEPIAQIGDRAADDHRHRIIDEGCFHLIGDINRRARMRVPRGGRGGVILGGFGRICHCAGLLSFRSCSAMTCCTSWHSYILLFNTIDPRDIGRNAPVR